MTAVGELMWLGHSSGGLFQAVANNVMWIKWDIMQRMLLVAAFSIYGCAGAEGWYETGEGFDLCREERCSVEYELDAYYTNVGLFINLTDDPIPYVGTKSEVGVYADLFSRSLKPRFMLLEASVYPMPLLGVAINENMSGFYDSMTFGGKFNLVESITAGFEEPYAVSLFVGNMVNYSRKDAEQQDNRGFMGFLVSGGNYHIRKNELLTDTWYEAEWKVKGDRNLGAESLSWSFRIGTKQHSHPHISDVGYIGIRRQHRDFDAPILSWLFNSGYDLEYQFTDSGFEPAGASFFIDKKVPVRQFGLAFSLGFGVVYNSSRKYTGPYRFEDETIFVIRPYFEF